VLGISGGSIYKLSKTCIYKKGASGIAYHNALIYLYSTNSSSFTLKICLQLLLGYY
jgi:hypothetical protein